jgi:hypothetical protein
MITYSISLLFVVQVWNIEFYQCLERVQIMLPVIEITRYQGDNILKGIFRQNIETGFSN